MKQQATPILILLAGIILALSSCQDPSIDPGPFAYPMEITVDQENHGVSLSWTRVDVSTFEEYVVLRSQDSIADTPEPEISGFTTVVARIDDITLNTFEDFQLPIESPIYYKVYARIGNRFLMSPTVRVDLSFQVIDLRADIMTADTLKNEIIGFDRTRNLLFRYNYQADEVVASGLFSYNSPIIRFGRFSGKDEIYLCDRNASITIVDRETMTVKAFMNVSFNVIDYQILGDLIIVTRNDNRIAVFDRGTLQQKSTSPSVAINPRFLAAANVNDELNVWEFSITQVAKYTINGTSISRDVLKDVIVSGTSPIVSPKPGYDHFVATNFGQIMDAELEPVTTLENGAQFYQTFTYDPEGRFLFTSGFGLNTAEIKTFDVDGGYSLIEEHPFSFSPTVMFADNGSLHAVTIVFVNGVVRTLIAKIDYE